MADLFIVLCIIAIACGYICVLGSLEWAGRRLLDWMTGP